MKFEPARIIALVVALLALAAAFGLALSDQQTGAIVAAVTALLQVAVGETVRAKVYSPGTVERDNPALLAVGAVPINR